MLLAVGCGGAVEGDAAPSTTPDGGEAGSLATGGRSVEMGGGTESGGEAGGPTIGDGGAGGARSVLCQENERVVSHECVPCPAGDSHPAGDDATGADTVCAPVLCAVNYHVIDHACEPCPAGTYNVAGDDASEADTACDDDPCQLVFGVTCDEFEQGYLKASNTGARDWFGYSVSLSGDTLAVGAPGEDSAATGVNGNQSDDSAEDSGAVYVRRIAP